MVAAARLGSPGPFEMTTPRGENDRIRAASVSAGTRTTATPRRARLRTMPCFAPQSMRTTDVAALGFTMRISGVVTSATRSRALGSPRAMASARSRRAFSGPSETAMRPGMTPWTRSFFVSARVSTPAIPGTPLSRSQSLRVLVEVACEGFSQSSETT